jgi:hypothetical protein
MAWIFLAWERAQMNATPPEANSEYSRGPGVSRARTRRREGAPEAGSPKVTHGAWRGVGTSRPPFLAAALLGSVVLVAAELNPLLSVRVAGTVGPVKTVVTGAHHGYALLPIAALSAVLSIAARRHDSRPALVALGALGLIALAIALVGDLPDARATGLVGSSATRYVQASSSPAIGLYLETLGAVLLLLGSGLGLLLLGPGEAGRRRLPWFGS